MRALWMLLAAPLAALAACDSKPDESPDLVKSQRQALDKAKGVGDTLQKSADERAKQAAEPK
jgi:hypothetical protein